MFELRLLSHWSLETSHGGQTFEPRRILYGSSIGPLRSLYCFESGKEPWGQIARGGALGNRHALEAINCRCVFGISLRGCCYYLEFKQILANIPYSVHNRTRLRWGQS
jgi:hypothetical protein